MIYLDTSYIVRLYLDNQGWERVRELAVMEHVACSIHGRTEVISTFHRKLREGVFTTVQYHHLLEQFEFDCENSAYRWLPLSLAVAERLSRGYKSLPKTVFLSSADALHLACAVENGFKEIYSNDQRLLAAAVHFGVKGVNIIT
jgi:predicted nucleic acid-binding protein